MDGNLNMMPGGGSYGSGVDLQLQEALRYNHHQQQQQQQQRERQGSMLHPVIHDVFPPLSMGMMQEQGCCRSVSLREYNETGRGRNVVLSDDDNDIEEDERSLMEDVGNCGGGRGGKGAKGGSVWHRVKWTDLMVKLLITAVSYVGQDASLGFGGGGGDGGRMKSALIHKKGKWKSISKVMAERGFFVSPQQCEDKFNDLNKRYKRLNEILGRGTSCQVVEKPELLDMMDNLSEKSKEDVRKILSSKQLFYEEMCSYHNGNRLHLPHDPALQRSLHLALESDNRRKCTDDYEEDNHGGESDDGNDFGECHTAHPPVTCGVLIGSSAKRTKQDLNNEEISFGNAQEVGKISQINPQNVHIDMNQACTESSKSAWYTGQTMQSCSLNLEEKRIKIQMEMLELEKQRLKWQKFSQKKDRELENMRLENERLKLENESMALELKRKELSFKRD